MSNDRVAAATADDEATVAGRDEPTPTLDAPDNDRLRTKSHDHRSTGSGVGGGSGDNDDERNRFLDDDVKSDGIGYWGAIAHLFRATVGTGILLLPYEMKNLGYVTGSLLLLAAGCLYYHIVHILLDLDDRLRRHLNVERLTVAVIADEIFAKSTYPLNRCRVAVLCVIYAYYTVPTSKSIALVVIAKNVEEMGAYLGVRVERRALLVASLAVVLTAACMCRRILKILVPFSTTTNALTLAIAAIVVVYSCAYRQPAAAVRPFGQQPSLMLRGFVIFVNAVLATDIVLPLKNGMRQPAKLAGPRGGVNTTACIVLAFYGAFAVVTYVNYGDTVRENVLENMPVNNALLFAANAVYSLALSVSYVLSFYACFDVVWTSKLSALLGASRYRTATEYGVRVAFNAAAYALAAGVSHLSLISAIGGIVGILVDVTLLPLLQIMLMFVVDEKRYWVVAKNVLLVCVSLVLFVMGIVDCVNEVRKLYS